MGKPGDRLAQCHAEGGGDVARAAKIHMRLEQKALDLAPLDLLLLFDEVERRGPSTGRSEPLFEVVKGAVGIYHILTVVLP
jgi:hypothetical protein